MRRNFLLFLGLIAAVLLAVNSFRRILTFRATTQKIAEAQARLERLKKENDSLKQEMQYKLSGDYQEAEIRNKLGLAKPNEAVFVLPKDEKLEETNKKDDIANWKKWWRLFFKG